MGEEAGMKASLYEALVGDELPKGQTLEEHDRQHHHGHFDPSKQSCKFREEMVVEIEADKADELDSGEGQKEAKQDTGREQDKATHEEEYQAVVDAFTNADGSKKEGWMKAPNGKDTNLTERQWVQVRTPSFKEWFGDWEKEPERASKVVDRNGEPKVCYHFTKAGKDFNEFKAGEGPSMYGPANYFFTNRKMAENWGNFEGEKRNIKECFLSLKKPYVDSKNGYEEGDAGFDVDALSKVSDESYARLVAQLEKDGLKINPNYDYGGYLPYEYKDGKQVLLNQGLAFLSNALVKEDKADKGRAFWKFSKEVNDALKKLGYDGVVGELEYMTQIAVFDGKQIKDANKNTGAFSKEDPDIRHSISDEGEAPEQFSEEFWAEVHPERGSSYSSAHGEDANETERREMDAYKANFTKDGKYKVPFKDGKFSKGVMEKAKSLRENGGDGGAWTAESRADAEAAGRVLSNLLGGVNFELSERAYGESGGGEIRKSISGIYTGSAADYDNPSLVHVGTGEGSQVYGWGLYGSAIRNVAEGYARQGRNLNVAVGYAEYELDGKTLNRKDDVIDSALTYLSSERMNTQKAIVEINKAIDGFKKQLEDTTERLEWDKNNFRLQMDAESLPKRIRHLNEVRGFIERDGGRIRQVLPSENLYEQTFFIDRVPGDESHLIKWYAPISNEQTGWIEAQWDKEKPKVTSKDAEEKLFARLLDGADGDHVYGWLSEALGSPKSASEFLARAGIDGIKYPVDSWGGKTIKDGDKAGWNYVSFRDDNIRVDHKWVDGEQRFFKNAAGRVVGEYNRKTGKITLYPGAKIKDVVHEFSHGLWQYAEQEAKAGRTGLSEKLHQIAESAPDAVKESVGRNYAKEKPNVILEECFTHEMARRSEQNKAFAKAISTARGKKWYQRAWGAIKETYAGFSKKMGWDKVDVGKLEKMGTHEAAEWILGQMAKGKRFGEVERPEPIEPHGSDGSRGIGEGKESDTRKSIIGEKGAKRLGIGKLDEAKKMTKDGADRKEIWEKTGWWKGKDGKWRVEIPDLKLKQEVRDYFKENDEFEGVGLKYLIDDKEMFKAYPALKNIGVYMFKRKSRVNPDEWGHFDPDEGEIMLFKVNPKNMAEVERRLSHEVQHAIQKAEGLAYGADSEDWEKYRKSAGEVEARNVQRRVKMDKTKAPPWETEDIPEEEQIVRDEMPAKAALMDALT